MRDVDLIITINKCCEAYGAELLKPRRNKTFKPAPPPPRLVINYKIFKIKLSQQEF